MGLGLGTPRAERHGLAPRWRAQQPFCLVTAGMVKELTAIPQAKRVHQQPELDGHENQMVIWNGAIILFGLHPR